MRNGKDYLQFTTFTKTIVVEMIVAKMVFYAIFISISAVKPPLFFPKKAL